MKIVPFLKLKGDENPDEVIPIALLSLDDQVKRREMLIKRGIPYEWVDSYLKCIDMRKADKCNIQKFLNEEQFESLYGRRILSSEVGCSLSHRIATNWLAGSCFNLMIIFEDDIVLQVIDFKERLIEISNFLMPLAKKGVPFICHLGKSEYQIRFSFARPVYSLQMLLYRRSILSKIFLYIGPDNIWLAHAYLISKSAAVNAYNIEKKNINLVDDWCWRKKKGVIDKIFFCNPVLFKQDKELDSTINFINHKTIYERKRITRIIDAIKQGIFIKRFLFHFYALLSYIEKHFPVFLLK